MHVVNKNICTQATNTGSFKHLPKSIQKTTFLLRQSSESFAHHHLFVNGARNVRCFDLHLLVDQIATMAKHVRRT